jgi:hypothetical protein
MNRLPIGPTSLLLVTACTGFPFFGKQLPSSPDPEAIQDAGSTDTRIPPSTRMELQDIQYDGWTLSGRLLLSPESGSLRLDRRLIPSIDVEVTRVSECERGSVKSIHADVFAPLNRQENLLILEPGYWYGTTVRFSLFDEHFTGLGPACIEADIILVSFDGKPVARQRIRGVRPSPMEGGTPLDGGMQEEPPPPQE